jgi:translation elongation factor aEF-1 beta
MEQPKRKVPTNVIAQIRVMPDGLEVDVDKLADQVQKVGSKGIQIREIAFGLKAIEAVFTVPDGEGGTEKIEKTLAALPGVSTVEVINLGREIDEDEFK